MAQKFYGVRLTDGQTAILTNWDDAKAFIAKNPKGAAHKSFKTEAEARAFVEQTELAPSVAHENMKTDCPKQRLIAYVDGSYNPDTKTWGYGVVMFDAADETHQMQLNGAGTCFAAMRNVTGELTASVNAIQQAIAMGFPEVILYHDYTGIAHWADGSWSTNNELTRHYQKTIGLLKNQIQIQFVKVDAHTGVHYNELVDSLAKQACGAK